MYRISPQKHQLYLPTLLVVSFCSLFSFVHYSEETLIASTKQFSFTYWNSVLKFFLLKYICRTGPGCVAAVNSSIVLYSHHLTFYCEPRIRQKTEFHSTPARSADDILATLNCAVLGILSISMTILGIICLRVIVILNLSHGQISVTNTNDARAFLSVQSVHFATQNSKLKTQNLVINYIVNISNEGRSCNNAKLD
jgi:hypothetical protein